MTISTQEAEEKRKQLLAKELAIKRNLSLVWKSIRFSRRECRGFFFSSYQGST